MGVRAEPAERSIRPWAASLSSCDVFAPVGDHHRPDGVVGVPPVFEQPLLGGERVVVEVEAAVFGGVGEVGLGVAGAEAGERLPFGGFVLAAVLAQLERVELVAEGGVEAAGVDRRELGRVADEDRLPLRRLDELEQRGEDACAGHSGFVDDEYAPVRESAVAGGVEEEPVQGAAGIPVAVWSSSAARPLGAAPTTGTPVWPKTSWSTASAVVLPAPAAPTTQTTRSRLSVARRTSSCCSRASSLAFSSLSSVWPSAVGAPASRPAIASSSTPRSSSSSSWVVNRAGRPGTSPGSTSSTPGKRDSSSAASSTCSTGAPSRSEPRPRGRARASRTSSASQSARTQPDASSSGTTRARPADADGQAAQARRRPRPCSAARASHCSRSRGRSTCSFDQTCPCFFFHNELVEPLCSFAKLE